MNREMDNIYIGGNQGRVNTAEQNLTHKTVEAKLKITHTRQGIGKIKEGVTNTETTNSNQCYLHSAKSQQYITAYIIYHHLSKKAYSFLTDKKITINQMLLPLPFLCVNGQKSFPVLTLFIKKKKKKKLSGPQPAGFKQAMPWLKKSKRKSRSIIVVVFLKHA